MRRAAKVDASQDAIVTALRAAGAKVQSLASVGGGVPDLLVGTFGRFGWGGRLVLLECKDGAKVPSKQALTPDQVEWHAEWAGLPVYVVNGPEAALRVIGAIA